MKNNIKYIFIFLLLSLVSLAQSTTKYPVFNDSYVINNSFAPITDTDDGGHLLQYSFNYFGGRDQSTMLIKTDGDFVPIWRKNFTTYLNGKRILSLSNGTSILFARCGCWNVEQPNGQMQWYCPQFKLHKFNDQGETIWSKTISGSTGSAYITPYDAFLKDANTIKIGGRKTPYTQNPVIMNFDLDGNFIAGTILQGLWGTVYSMSKENTGNYYALVSNYICKFNQDDALIWIKEINIANAPIYINDNYSDVNCATKILNNGDLLVACKSQFNGITASEVLLIRVSPQGNLIWSKKVNGSSGHTIGGITALASGEIAFSIVDAHLNYVLKITPNGDLIWVKGYRNSSSTSELYEKNSNEWYFAVFGYNINNIDYHQPTVFTTDNSGNSSCDGFDANKTMSDESITLTIPQTTISQIPLASLQSTPDTTTNLILLENQFSSTECSPLSIPEFSNSDILLYPNPNTGDFIIKSNSLIEKVEIFTVLGQKISEIKTAQIEFPVTLKDSGIYIVRMETTYGSKVIKVIVTK